MQIEELSHDKVIFDGGTHRGLGYAEIAFPLSAADDSLEGETIQMRIAGESGPAWVDVGVIEGRALDAVVRHPRRPDWQIPTFRIRGGDGRTKSAENRFAVGSVIGLWGQSDLFHVFYLGSSDVRGPEVEGECLEVAMIRQRDDEPQPPEAGIRRFVTNDWPDGVLSRSRTMPATVELHPGGDERMVAVGWSGGAVTTPHLADGRPRLDGRPDVCRFALGDRPLNDAFI